MSSNGVEANIVDRSKKFSRRALASGEIGVGPQRRGSSGPIDGGNPHQSGIGEDTAFARNTRWSG